MAFRAVFLGPPGAGKGTQSARLLARGDVVHISTGDMLRDHRQRGTELGKQAETFMDAGKLVPDELIIAMVEERLGGAEEGDSKNGADPASESWILDGFPRTLPQAQALDQSLGDRLTHVIYFRVPHDILVQRLSGRWTCSSCGAIWHDVYKPVRVSGVCDKCSSELRQRADDKPEAVRERLQVYTAQTEPLLAHYGDQGILTEVDANRSPDEVFESLTAALSQD